MKRHQKKYWNHGLLDQNKGASCCYCQTCLAALPLSPLSNLPSLLEAPLCAQVNAHNRTTPTAPKATLRLSNCFGTGRTDHVLSQRSQHAHFGIGQHFALAIWRHCQRIAIKVDRVSSRWKVLAIVGLLGLFCERRVIHTTHTLPKNILAACPSVTDWQWSTYL